MNQTRFLLIAVVVLALGGLLASVVYRTLQARTAGPKTGVDAVMAAKDILVGAQIEDRDVKIVKFPAEDLPAHVFHGENDVVGRRVVLPIAKGDFILPNKLSAKSGSELIPPGMRAVSVRVNEFVGVAGFVIPGTHVDVLMTGTPAGGVGRQTITVLKNVAVIAVGQKLERHTSGVSQVAPVITLLVSPLDALKLTLASQQGRIQLLLNDVPKNYNEREEYDVPIPPRFPNLRQIGAWK